MLGFATVAHSPRLLRLQLLQLWLTYGFCTFFFGYDYSNPSNGRGYDWLRLRPKAAFGAGNVVIASRTPNM